MATPLARSGRAGVHDRLVLGFTTGRARSLQSLVPADLIGSLFCKQPRYDHRHDFSEHAPDEAPDEEFCRTWQEEKCRGCTKETEKPF